MILTTRLKIWTLVSHACILIGIGHGIVTLGIVEFFWFSTIFNKKQTAGGDEHVSLLSLQLVACMGLAGQIATVTSLTLKHSTAGKWMHIGALCLLWASVMTYAYGIRNDRYAHLAILSCLPFAFCTLWTFFGRHIGVLWQKIDERM